jgi:aminopeptidase
MTRVTGLGAQAYVIDTGKDNLQKLLANATEDDLKQIHDSRLAIMKQMDCYIRVRDNNDSLLTPPDIARIHNEITRDATDYRVDNTRWLVVEAPTVHFAKACGMKKSDFNIYYTNACTVGYDKMARAVEPLKELMERTDRVRITGRETDLSFSIKDIGVKPCIGLRNRPDGECYSAPVIDSVNGTILHVPSNYFGEFFSGIKLTYKDGRIIDAKAENDERTAALNKIFDTDAGARYVGEFAIAFHPTILHPMGSSLFDEKIAGSIHFTPGQCYTAADNGNKSKIHWDLVHIQRPEYGGGEIYFDDKLIRKDGIFVLPELQGLNPESLKL